MYEAVKAARRRAVGTRQSLRAAAKGEAAAVYIARDAEAHVVRPLLEQCRKYSVPIHYVDSMVALGQACGIKVGTASAAVIKEPGEGGAELADH